METKQCGTAKCLAVLTDNNLSIHNNFPSYNIFRAEYKWRENQLHAQPLFSHFFMLLFRYSLN